jgi:hypothetical protein
MLLMIGKFPSTLPAPPSIPSIYAALQRSLPEGPNNRDATPLARGDCAAEYQIALVFECH